MYLAKLFSFARNGLTTLHIRLAWCELLYLQSSALAITNNAIRPNLYFAITTIITITTHASRPTYLSLTASTLSVIIKTISPISPKASSAYLFITQTSTFSSTIITIYPNTIVTNLYFTAITITSNDLSTHLFITTNKSIPNATSANTVVPFIICIIAYSMQNQ
jgi:hypothetical protein